MRYFEYFESQDRSLVKLFDKYKFNEPIEMNFKDENIQDIILAIQYEKQRIRRDSALIPLYQVKLKYLRIELVELLSC